MEKTRHVAVLAEEVIRGLYLTSGETVIDATLGGGGHTLLLKEAVGETGKVFSLDMDIEAITRFEARAQADDSVRQAIVSGGLTLIHANFSDIARVVEEASLKRVDVIFADLGYSSDQMDDESRGLSFMRNGPLDMRLNRECKETAAHIVNVWSVESLTQLFAEAGDEECAASIARALVERRRIGIFSETQDLASVIAAAIPTRIRTKRKMHPATKVFQSLRIAVNDEFQSLHRFLEQSMSVLVSGGRIGIISFHSGEDRIVKQFFHKQAKGCECPPSFPVCVCGKEPRLRILTPTPIVPSTEEENINPRSRSAKLRIAERI